MEGSSNASFPGDFALPTPVAMWTTLIAGILIICVIFAVKSNARKFSVGGLYPEKLFRFSPIFGRSSAF